HALAERERRGLDLLREEDFLLLAERRDLRDVAEVRHERAALARTGRLARRIEPLRVDAHAADRAGVLHRRTVGLGAELVLGSDLAPGRPTLLLDRVVLVRVHLVSLHGGASSPGGRAPPGGPASGAERPLRSAPRVQAADMLCRFAFLMWGSRLSGRAQRRRPEPGLSLSPSVTPH